MTTKLATLPSSFWTVRHKNELACPEKGLANLSITFWRKKYYFRPLENCKISRIQLGEDCPKKVRVRMIRLVQRTFSTSRDVMGYFHWLKWKIELSPRNFRFLLQFDEVVFVEKTVKMGSTGVELDNLGANLTKVREKFMEWTGESFKKSRMEDKENHENVLLDGKGAVFVNEILKLGSYEDDWISLSYIHSILYLKRKWSIWKRRSINITFKARGI